MANDVVTGVDGFGEALTSMCMQHVAEQGKAMEKLVEKAAKTSANELRDGPLTPANTGTYAASFRAKRTGGDALGSVEWTVGNVHRHGNLTHLLENGHVLFYHGRPTNTRTRAFPHIVPAYVVGAEIIREATVDQ